jgi:hypothetical protein
MDRNRSDQVPEWADKLFHAKAQRRRRLARLPIEEKIRILGDLQELADEIRTIAGRPKRRP